MKIFIRVLVGLLIALAIGVSMLCIYGWEQAQKQANRARTAAATDARWRRKPPDDDDDDRDEPEYVPPVKKGTPVTEVVQPENQNVNEKGT